MRREGLSCWVRKLVVPESVTWLIYSLSTTGKIELETLEDTKEQTILDTDSEAILNVLGITTILQKLEELVNQFSGGGLA